MVTRGAFDSDIRTVFTHTDNYEAIAFHTNKLTFHKIENMINFTKMTIIIIHHPPTTDFHLAYFHPMASQSCFFVIHY